MSKPTEFDHATHRVLDRLVSQNVLHNLCQTIGLLTANPEALTGSGWSYEDDVLPLLFREEWEEPADCWARETADLDELIEACELLELDAVSSQVEALRGAIRGAAAEAVDVEEISEACVILGIETCSFIASDDPDLLAEMADQLRYALTEGLQGCKAADKLSAALDVLATIPHADDVQADAIRKAVRAELDADKARELCGQFDIEPETSEAYEFYAVDSWFAGKLAERGEAVGELLDFHVWGRTCTGQAIALDCVIREIAESMEILPGQRNTWEGGEQ